MMTLTLGWDSSPSANITNYSVYYGTVSRSYGQKASAGPTTQTSLGGFSAGTTYYLAVTATDTNGMESDYSNEVSFTVPAMPATPQLTLVRSGTKSVASWYTNYAGFTLQWSSNPKGTWSNVASQPVTSGGRYFTTNTTSSAQRYYRLKK